MDYGGTLGALSLKPSGFCNIRVYAPHPVGDDHRLLARWETIHSFCVVATQYCRQALDTPRSNPGV